MISRPSLAVGVGCSVPLRIRGWTTPGPLAGEWSFVTPARLGFYRSLCHQYSCGSRHYKCGGWMKQPEPTGKHTDSHQLDGHHEPMLRHHSSPSSNSRQAHPAELQAPSPASKSATSPVMVCSSSRCPHWQNRLSSSTRIPPVYNITNARLPCKAPFALECSVCMFPPHLATKYELNGLNEFITQSASIPLRAYGPLFLIHHLSITSPMPTHHDPSYEPHIRPPPGG